VILLLPVAAAAQERWSDPATWGGAPPTAGAVATIPAGRTVLLDTRTPSLAGIVVRGTLLAREGDVALTAGYVLVEGGRLEIGTAAAPFRGRATITLTGTTTAAPTASLAHFGNKVLALHGGTISLHGAPVGTTWTRLAADAPAGATTLTLAQPVEWRAGDRIVVATSSRNADEAEVREIAAVQGTSVTLAQPLRFRHFGTVRSAGGVAVDVRAEVGLLSHNVVVQGDDGSEASRIGGHAMFMNGATPARVQLQHVTFRRMGQLNVTGRYPMHFHLMGSAAQGSYVRGAAIDGSIQRGIVLHGVSGVELSGNVVYNTVGHNVVVEDVNTTGNLLDRNLALSNRQASPLQTTPELRAQNDRLPANFWFKSGRNTVTRNHAAGSLSSGFSYDEIGGEPIDFRGNVAHAAMSREGAGAGDFDITAGLLLASGEARPAGEVIADVLLYHNHSGAWPEEKGRWVIDRMLAADNDIQTFNRSPGNLVTYRAPVFVGRLTETRTEPGPMVLIQYGSDVRLESPTVVAYADGRLVSPVDIAQVPIGTLTIANMRVVGAPPLVPIPDENIVTYEDDSFQPRGSYVSDRRFAPASCPRVQVGTPEPEPAYRCPRAYRYTELDVRDRGALSTRLHRRVAIRRSDGVGFTGGMFGYSTILDAGLRYELPTASARGFALRLNHDFAESLVPLGPSDVVPVSVPVSGVPAAVARGGTGNPPSTLTNTVRLRAASDAADFAANPLTTFLYDAAARRVLAHADRRWLLVVTDAPVTIGASVAAAGACPSPRDAAVAALLARARREPLPDIDGDGRRDATDLVTTLRRTEDACRR
jgi:hypothetical protein